MLIEIRSLENPRVQIFRAIREKKVTTEKKVCIIEAAAEAAAHFRIAVARKDSL